MFQILYPCLSSRLPFICQAAVRSALLCFRLLLLLPFFSTFLLLPFLCLSSYNPLILAVVFLVLATSMSICLRSIRKNLVFPSDDVSNTFHLTLNYFKFCKHYFQIPFFDLKLSDRGNTLGMSETYSSTMFCRQFVSIPRKVLPRTGHVQFKVSSGGLLPKADRPGEGEI